MAYWREVTVKRLVIAGCVEDEGRFIDDIVNSFWWMDFSAGWIVNNLGPLVQWSFKEFAEL